MSSSIAINTCINLIEPTKLQIFIVLLYIISKDKTFKYMLLLFSFTILYSGFLKPLIGVPLPDTCPNIRYWSSAGGVLPPRFGFPGGHVHISCIFYIWLIVRNRNLPLSILSILIVGIAACGQVLKGYHYVSDVMFAPVFALITLTSFNLFLMKKSDITKFVIISVASIAMVYGIHAFGFKYLFDKDYLFTNMYQIIGFCVGCAMFNGGKISNKNIVYLCIIGFFSSMVLNSSSSILNQMHWVFLSALLPLIKTLTASSFEFIKGVYYRRKAKPVKFAWS